MQKESIVVKDPIQFPPLSAAVIQKPLGKGQQRNNQKVSNSQKMPMEQLTERTSKSGTTPNIPPKPAFRSKGNLPISPHGWVPMLEHSRAQRAF